MWCLAGERHFALAAVDEARWGESAKLQEVLEANQPLGVDDGDFFFSGHKNINIYKLKVRVLSLVLENGVLKEKKQIAPTKKDICVSWILL